MDAAMSSTPVSQRLRPRSLRPPKIGLLIALGRNIPLKAKPVHLESYPWAFCKKSEPRLPMLAPAKSRRLNSIAQAKNDSHSIRVGNIPWGRIGTADGCATVCSLSPSHPARPATPTLRPRSPPPPAAKQRPHADAPPAGKRGPGKKPNGGPDPTHPRGLPRVHGQSSPPRAGARRRKKAPPHPRPHHRHHRP